MIRSHDALLRHAQDFFLLRMAGLYHWDHVGIAAPERAEAIPSTVSYRERRRLSEAREGKGKYLERARLIFPLPIASARWEILIYSSMERPPLGEVSLRDPRAGESLITGPLDPATWEKIGNWIRSADGQRRAS